MTVTLIFFLIIVGIALWWLLHQQLAAKPWLEEGVVTTGGAASGTLSYPAAKVGLWVLMAVISSLFALLIGAYFMRMGFSDWRSLQLPKLLWLNTGALILSSVFLQGAQIAVHRRQMDAVRARLLIGGAFGIAFVAGQLRAWDQLRAAGEIMAINPSNSFFYLITGLHGLHVLGGLIALGITADRVWRSVLADRIRLSVEMCATYWHFLLVVWLVLFGMLTGGADDIGRLCSQLIS
jgi:cytochrome c oxidase subunit III